MKHVLRKIEAVDVAGSGLEDADGDRPRGAETMAASGRVVVLPERLNWNGGPQRRGVIPRG